MEKINILFICGGGMSSSLVALKMEEAAKKQGIDAEIWAVGVGRGKETLAKRDDIDVLLIGPQVRYEAQQLEKIAKEKNRDTVIQVADMRDYGRVDGEKLLNHSLELIAARNLASN